ncbi:MAG: hypothetical protein IIA65_06205 [Planctomycetes bacterium]|nr:hypothetical protein [Planctomycetota bacterium]
MSGQQEGTDQEVVESGNTGVVESGNTGVIEGIEQPLTPLQYHYLSLLQRLVSVKNSYQTDPKFEAWMMGAINKSIYATLRDSIEANVGDAAKELLHSEHHVN